MTEQGKGMINRARAVEKALNRADVVEQDDGDAKFKAVLVW